MQRIKSQSTCNTHNIAITSQSRPRSKKTAKAQSIQMIYSNPDKNKHSQANITQNSMVSMKSNSKLLAAASTKNLRNYQNVGKSSVQNTSRVVNGQQSAISARILKQIVGYSQRGVSGTKNYNNESQHHDIKQQIRLKIDLDYQIGKVYQKQDQQPRTTLSQDRHKSYQASNNKSQQSIHKQKDCKAPKQNKKQHRVIQQFEPLSIAQQNQSKEKFKDGNKKYSFFNSVDEDRAQIGYSQIYEQQNTDRNTHGNQLSSVNFQTWKNLTIQNLNKSNEDENSHDITYNFMKIGSPQHNLYFQQKQTESILKCKKLHQQLDLNKQNMKKVSNKQIVPQINLSKAINENQQNLKNTQEQSLLQEKEKLIIVLQQSSAFLDQKFQLKYKQIIPFWKGIIEAETKQNQINQQINKLQLSLKQYQSKQFAKKTQLFQLNRDQLCRKKQKQYITKSSKQKYLQQAISCQQGLKLKLSSKADYQHVVLFNEKVILSGQSSFDDLHKIFEEMFENKLSKKFALIAKKQLANLSVYDSRLVQDFLKRIQQLQSLYIRSDTSINQTQSINCHYSSVNQQQKLQNLVEEIQQIVLNVQCFNSKIITRKGQNLQLLDKINQFKNIVQQYIKSTNKKISGQYKMIEGYSFDFQLLLEQKYDNEFQQFRKQISYRSQIMNKLNKIQKQLATLRAKQQKYQEESLKNSQRTYKNHTQKSQRSSVSFVSTPTRRSPLKLEKDYRTKQIQIQQNSSRMFKKCSPAS